MNFIWDAGSPRTPLVPKLQGSVILNQIPEATSLCGTHRGIVSGVEIDQIACAEQRRLGNQVARFITSRKIRHLVTRI